MSGDPWPEGKLLERLVDAPTVRVDRIELPDGRYAVRKLYFFPRWSQRLRGALRHTWLGQPKGEREADNLRRLAAGGAPVVEPLASGSRRDALGFVRESWLLLPLVSGSFDEFSLWPAAGEGVRRIHDLGCFYRDLRLRNLLVGEDGPLWIDASKSRWHTAPLAEPWAAEDLAGLFLPLDPSVAAQAWPEFCAGYGRFEDLPDPSYLLSRVGRAGRRRIQRVVAREALRCQDRTLSFGSREEGEL